MANHNHKIKGKPRHLKKKLDKNKKPFITLQTTMKTHLGEEKIEQEQNCEDEMKLFSRKYTKRKRFSQDDASLIPCILENPDSLKLVGHDDIDCYMRKSDLSEDSYEMALGKHGPREENSVENDAHFEKQGSETGLISLEPISKSVECDSSASNLEDLENEEACQTSDVAEEENSKLRTDSFNTFTEANVQYGGYDVAYEEYLKSFGEDFDLSKELFDFGYINQHDEDEIGLVDVHLTVNTSYRAENVPCVCLTSELDGKSVIGHPVEIEELTDSSDEEGESILDRLVWKTSRRTRTPVCYGKNLVYSVSKFFKSDGNQQMYMMVPNQFRKGRTQPNACCVPVERIFSKILAGVGQVQAQNTC